ncbi:MAG: HlyD family secretion protein [Hahellaceae bacterium]|nr:HlyD family secretion protein [Hahellaceae bacterium]
MTTPKLKAKSIGRIHIIMLAGLVAIAMGGYHIWQGRMQEKTDDAFIERNILYIKPRLSGVIVELPITDNQTVQQGELLARIDPAPFQAAVDLAQANVLSARTLVTKSEAEQQAFLADLAAREQSVKASIQVAREDLLRQKTQLTSLDAQIEQAQREVVRYTQLQARQQVSKQILEESRTRLDTLKSQHSSLEAAVRVADAQLTASHTQSQVVEAEQRKNPVYLASIEQARAALKAAEAALENARLQLGWTEIRAPHAGVVSKLQSRVGAQIDPTSAIGILVYGEPWVVANFKETQIRDMRSNDKVVLELDAYPGQLFSGHLESFQAGTGARFSLLPPENASGNFVKVVQRVPIRILFDEIPENSIQLWPGMSVTPTVQLRQ